MIDAHVHVWNLESARYDWPDASVPDLFRTFELADVLPELSALGVTGVILVEAADMAADTRNMLRTADLHPEVRGVVGWVEMDAPTETFERELLELRRDARVVGLRNLMHVKGREDWILQPRPDAALAVLERHGVPFDAVVSSHTELPVVEMLLDRHPDLTVVLDHLGKPPVGGTAAELNAWRRALERLAVHPRLVAKLSGLYPAGDLAAWEAPDLRPIVDVALEVLGPNRLMYGGDWPLARLAGGLAKTHSALMESLVGLNSHDVYAVTVGTAERTYVLTNP